ncbi:MAG: hypothetical protein Tsb0014_44150 [Pleurocapsa sp.]
MLNVKSMAIAIITIATVSACKINPQIEVDRSGLIDVAEITQNPTAYMGQSVLVRNDAIATVGKRGLILDKDRAFSGDTILVITPAAISLESAIETTPEFLVSGKVEQLSLARLQQQSGLNLDPNLYRQYENQPVIIADSVIFSPDPEDLTRSPEAYYGKPLAVKGELEDIKSYGVFELDEEQVFGGEDLVVVQPKPRIKLAEEQTAIVYGTLRPFIIVELERDYDLEWDLSIRKEIEAEYSQKPVLVADKIQLLEP